jgi:site-specific recombinase XerC
MTFERLQRERGEFTARLIGKGNKEIRALIRGRAATALTSWLAVMKEGGFTTGPIWRTKTGVVTEKILWHMLRKRGKTAKLEQPISPHMFRVSFLTYNPAGIEAKQDAAGHADMNTTRLYDRTSWRGREAFEKMPEVEDADE